MFRRGRGGFMYSLLRLFHGRKRIKSTLVDDDKMKNEIAVSGASAAMRQVQDVQTQSEKLPPTLPEIQALGPTLSIHVNLDSEFTSTVTACDETVIQESKSLTVFDETLTSPNPSAAPALFEAPQQQKHDAQTPNLPRLSCTSATPRRLTFPFRFLDLPGEIRRLIYKVLCEPEDVHFAYNPHVGHRDEKRRFFLALRCATPLTNLLRVNHQVYIETVGAILEFSAFNFATHHYDKDILSSLWKRKITESQVQREIISGIKRLKCDDALFARAFWKRRRLVEKAAGLAKGDVSEILGNSLDSTAKVRVQLGAWRRGGVDIGRLKEITLLLPMYLFRGLTIPSWATAKWFTDQDDELTRVTMIVGLRQFLDDHRRHAQYGLKVVLRPAGKGYNNREIELRFDGTIIVRGIKSGWRELAAQKLDLWLQLTERNTIVFEDDRC